MKAVRVIAVVAVGVLGGFATTVEAGPTPRAASCAAIGDTRPAVDGFPGRMSSLLGSDIRTGGHDCFERVVLEFEGSGDLPGYRVEYEPDPILDSPSGEPVDVAGDATLVLSVGAWMTDTEGNGYGGPAQIIPTNVVNILELRQIENHEGQHQWAIGLDRERGFRVSTLTEPTRIVIDIALDPGAAPPTTTDSGPAPTEAPVTTQGPVTTQAPASTQASVTTQAPVATEAPVTTGVPAATEAPVDSEAPAASTEGHPLVGSWLLVDPSDPEAPPFLGAFTSDGIYHEAHYDGSAAYGSWEATGPTSAALTLILLFPDDEGGVGGSVKARATVEVNSDGQTLTAEYTIEWLGEGGPPGEYGPSAVTGTRIGVERMGTPVGSTEDFSAGVGEGTDAAPPTTA